jgi:hypothetical protein
VADTVAADGHEVRYQVLCRAHYRRGELGAPELGEQLTLD